SKLTTTVAMLKDISVGGGSSKPNEFIEFQGKLYFNANDGVNDKELWVTDGTAAGTVMVQNINSSGDGNPRDFIVSNDLLYFSANDGIHGDELWKFSNNPIIGSLDPIDNGIEVSIDSKLKITFNKDVQKNNGNITIYDASDDSVVETINITSANITINGSQVTIEPSTNFTLAKQYYVQIDNGAIKDVNNTLFSGISDKTTWNFETIGKQNQTITFNTVPAKNFRDSDFQLTASASSNLAVSYTSSNTNVATISGNTVTIIGSGTTTITASQLGDANYNAAADVTQNLTINKINQTITFSSLIGKTFGDTDFQLTATSSSNLPITYTSSNTNAVTISGDIATIVGAGTTIITASQVGNSNYNAANNTNQILTVSNASQTITFTLNFTNNRVYGQAPRTLNASSDSGLPITYTSSDPSVIAVNGNVISFVGVGNGIIITAKQAGNNNYSAAPDVTQTINVSKAGQIITFNPPTNVTYGGQNFFLTATSNSGIPMTFTSLDSNIITLSGNEAFILNAGSTSLQASNNGNAFYIAYASVKTITVNKANQSIIFNSLPNVGVNDSDFNLTAVSTGGLPVSYSSSNPSVASVNGNVVSVHSLGTTTFTASQTGNNNYNAASNVSQTLTVSNTASINDFEKLAFEIYPNPTSSVFQIKSNLTIDKVEIYNLLGQKVKQFTSLNSKEFSISQLKNGLYLIKIYTEKGIGSKRIMKISR
ncbi:MAG: T9SS type A sorting domain-containing protein, partial [Polaribacter sp.]